MNIRRKLYKEKDSGEDTAPSPGLSLENHPLRHLIFGPNVPELAIKKHFELIDHGLRYSAQKVGKPSEKLIESKLITL